MRLVLIALAAVSGSSVAFPSNELTASAIGDNAAIMRPDTGDTTCREGFVHYQGWCVFNADFFGEEIHLYNYGDAVAMCERVGVFAPSIHSFDDLRFWQAASHFFGLFWLDAQCSDPGQPYEWLDGTPTDYYGPKNELLNCTTVLGLTMQGDGLHLFPHHLPAYALCAYECPTCESRITHTPIARSTHKPFTPQPTNSDVTSNYCSCNATSIYLDIVFVVDTSDGMARDIVTEATTTIQATLNSLSLGTGPFQSNVAALAYAESVQVVRDFGGFRSTGDISSFSLPYLGGKSDKMADAIKQASTMISSSGRDFPRGVTVLLTDSFDQLQAANIDDAAKAFKDDGGVIISIDYSNGLGAQGLKDITNPGYYMNDVSTNPNLDSELLYAFCDANCFCQDGLAPYSVANERDREVPTGCFHVSEVTAVYNAAESNCKNQNGFVATIHDSDKNLFLTSLFPVKTAYWIGLRRNGANYEWADGSTDPYTNWANGNPIVGQDCVYTQQTTGFNSPWFSSPCADPEKNSMHYACQSRPCGTDFNCFA